MFVFEDILLLNSNAVKEILAKVDRKILTADLKGTSEQLRNHMLQAMSQRGAESGIVLDALGTIRAIGSEDGFAFIGFETLVNMAEDTIDPTRTVPMAIAGAIVLSLLLYLGVSWSVVLADNGAANPLLALFDGAGARIFATIAFLGVANGVLVEILMLSRLIYGMARSGQAPAALGQVDTIRQSPIRATFAAGGAILAATIALPFESLLVAANAVTLGVFLFVDLALLAWK